MNDIQLLIIEDDAIIGLDLKKRLNKLGLNQVKLFADVQKALAYLTEEPCDLILMDIGLPGQMDGIQAATIIRKRHQIPVIFVTGFADDKTLERARLAEPAGYILKPFKEHEIYATISISVYRSQMEARLRHQQEMQKAIISHIRDGIITLDSERRLQYLNPRATALISEDGYAAISDFSRIAPELDTMCQQIAGREAGYSQTWNNHLFSVKDEVYILDITISRLMLPLEGHEEKGYLLVLHDKTRLKTMEAQVAYHETHDRLTGLLNRAEFQKHLDGEISRYFDDERALSLVYLDLDQFNLINEIGGHLAGDELLKDIARSLQTHFPHALAISRLGDDEFAMLLPGDPQTLTSGLNEYFHYCTSRKFEFGEKIMPYSFSAGISHFTKEVMNSHILLSIAIDASALAKQDAGSSLRVLSLQDEVFLKRRGELKWISILTEALEQNRFLLYFQPIIPIQDDVELRNKVEILIRLEDEEGNIIPPIEFIPAAERYNLMHLVDRWVIHALISNFDAAVENTGLQDPVFCINLSGASMLSGDLKNFIISEIKTMNINPSCLCFEITETSAIANMSNATSLIKSLRDYGCLFALDDFGNGFSNFNYLRYLEVDYLKIDGSFVKNMHENKVSKAMVEAIHRLSEAVDIKTIAEFVSNDAILVLLKEIGVHYAQGYALGRPVQLLGSRFQMTAGV